MELSPRKESGILSAVYFPLMDKDAVAPPAHNRRRRVRLPHMLPVHRAQASYCRRFEPGRKQYAGRTTIAHAATYENTNTWNYAEH